MCWWSFKMMKLHLIYVTLWSVAQAAYLSRMAIMNNPNSPIVGPNVGPNLNQHVRIRSSAFRPGVMMRPWTNPRFVQAASHRTPYVVYRNNQSPHRYAIKNYGPSRLIVWKGRPQGATPAEYEFVRAVTAAPKPRDGGTGAIHTIPAPNLSLAEKPIVVADDAGSGFTSETPKITYEVTEKFQDPAQMPAKIEQPIGFSKTTSFSFTPSELHSIVRNGATLQFPNELGISPLGLPHSAFSQSTLPPLPMVSSQSNILPHNIVAQPFLPQEFRVSSPNDMIQAGPGGIVISPDALYQPDPDFLQKLQNQLLQRFPGVEFVPYPADVHGPVQPQPQPQYPQQQSFSPQAPQQFQPQTQQPQPQQYPPQPQQYPPQPQQYPPQPQQHPPQPQPQQSQSQHSQPHQPPQLQPQIQPQSQPTLQQLQPQAQLPFFLLQNEQYTRPPSYLIEPQKSIVQRETQEGTVTLIPQVTTSNATEKRTESTSTTPQNLQNVTFELVAAESRPETTTIQYVVETTTGHQTTSPVYMQFAPVPQHVSSHQAANQLLQKVVFLQNAQNSIQPIQKESEKLEKNNTKEVNQSVRTDGQYSAVNDIRAVVGIEEKEKPQQNPEKENTTTTSTSTSSTSTTTTTSSTTTLQPDVKPYFIPQPDQIKNQSVTELKPLPGVPFAKSPNSVNVAYTLLRSNEKETKVAKDGSVYAGQIVEASVSEDHDFNKQKANLLTRRAPVRLVGVADNKEASTSSVRGPEKTTVVKAKIPPKSKLTFDENGEPVLRIYASYVGNASQKETVTSKLANVKNMKEVARKQENVDNWRGNVKALAKPFEPNPNNQVTKFGLKLRSRSDDYVPLFDEYYEE